MERRPTGGVTPEQAAKPLPPPPGGGGGGSGSDNKSSSHSKDNNNKDNSNNHKDISKSAEKQKEEQQLVAGALAAECQQDKTFIESLLERVEQWSYATETLIPFIRDMQRIERNTAKSYAKLSSSLNLKLPTTTEPTSGGLNDGIKSIKQFTTNVGFFHDSYAKYLEDQTLDALNKLQKDVQAKAKALRKRLNSMSLQQVREPAVNAIQAHSKAYEALLAQDATLASLQLLRSQGLGAQPTSPRASGMMSYLTSSTTPATAPLPDPWMSEMKVKSEIVSLVNSENEYKENMIRTLKEIEATDNQLGKTLKEVLSNFAKWRGRQVTTMKDEAAEIEKKMDALRPEVEWAHFVHEKNLIRPQVWEHKIKAEEFDYPYKNGEKAAILKQGNLYRQGRVISSNWKPGYYILTVTGWLHCFESKDAVFGSTSGKPFPAEPVYSFDIKESTVGIPSDEKDVAKYKNCVFELKSGKSKRELIKANFEEEMVDWICVIKDLVYATTARVEEVVNGPSGGEGDQTATPPSPSPAHSKPHNNGEADVIEMEPHMEQQPSVSVSVYPAHEVDQHFLHQQQQQQQHDPADLAYYAQQQQQQQQQQAFDNSDRGKEKLDWNH
eukprot:TRINITY_DN2451_c1_g3_i3.p1 TRINITY_DN2451_c1_g3~~TRINITY_DN2451_c1_g3_i3.p1  ORF type:complete len:609 (+),score=191.99 TRINITY_DN2451_c1_g3_i3:120-1946(+)